MAAYRSWRAVPASHKATAMSLPGDGSQAAIWSHPVCAGETWVPLPLLPQCFTKWPRSPCSMAAVWHEGRAALAASLLPAGKEPGLSVPELQGCSRNVHLMVCSGLLLHP